MIEKTISSTRKYFELLAAHATEKIGQEVNVHFDQWDINIYPCYRVNFIKTAGFNDQWRENFHKINLICLTQHSDDPSMMWKLMDAFFSFTRFSSRRVNQFIEIPIYEDVKIEDPVEIGKMKLARPIGSGFDDKVIKNDDNSDMVIFDHLLIKYKSL